MTIGQLDCCSSSCRNAFAYSLQGLKFCPFDCSTRTRLRLAAAAGNEAEKTIPRATRHFNTEFTSIPVRGAIDGGREKCSQYGCPLRITIRIDFTQQPSFRSTVLLRVTCQSTKCRKSAAGLAGLTSTPIFVAAFATGAVGVFVAITATLRRTRSAASNLEAIVLTPGPPIIHRDVFALNVTGFPEPMQKSGHVNCVSIW